MRTFNLSVRIALILTLLLGPVTSVSAEHSSGGAIPIIVVGIGFLALAIYDIATAPASARRYNAQLSGIPTSSFNRQAKAVHQSRFGKPVFSRELLVAGDKHASTFVLGSAAYPTAVSTLNTVQRFNSSQVPNLQASAQFGHPAHSPSFFRIQPENALKSPRTALYWSLGATLIPAAVGFGLSSQEEAAAVIGLSGATIGPSTGHWYAKQTNRGLKTLGLRVGFGLLGFAFLQCCT